MAISELSPEALEYPPSQELLADVASFISTTYTFSIDPKYKGFWGKLRAIADKSKIEKQEKLDSCAHVRPQPPIVWDDVDFSESSEDEHLSMDRQLVQERNHRIVDRQLEFADFFKNLATEKKFADALLELIAEKGRDTVDVYKSANLDRRLFSKIRNTEDYIPSKKTVLAFAIALELSLEETQELLAKAGYTLSRSILFDVIIEYFISHKMYNIFEINNTLYLHKQQLLGEIKNVASKATHSPKECDKL